MGRGTQGQEYSFTLSLFPALMRIAAVMKWVCELCKLFSFSLIRFDSKVPIGNTLGVQVERLSQNQNS